MPEPPGTQQCAVEYDRYEARSSNKICRRDTTGGQGATPAHQQTLDVSVLESVHRSAAPARWLVGAVTTPPSPYRFPPRVCSAKLPLAALNWSKAYDTT